MSCKKRTISFNANLTQYLLPIVYSPHPFVNKQKKSAEQKNYKKNVERWQNRCLNAAVKQISSQP